MDTGRFYADTHGSIVRQTIKLCPGMAGAVACNNLVLLQALPLQEIMATDGFGRTAAMLAALYNSWEVLHHMLQLPEGINWSQTQSKQASLALLLWIFCTSLSPVLAHQPQTTRQKHDVLLIDTFAGWLHWQDSTALPL